MSRTLNDLIKSLPHDQQLEIETQAARLIEDEMMLRDPRTAHTGDCAMEKELYEILAAQGIRIFSLVVGTFRMLYIHPQKTTQEWRSDVRGIIDEINTLNDTDGCSDDAVCNELIRRMADAGYLEVADVASDTYEGRIVVHSASIKDDPEHKEQADGFGHHGWESK